MDRTTRTATRCSRPRSWSADQTFSSVRVLDLGDRQVELVHPGRGHTAGDAVVRVADADVVLAGDLVEESGPAGVRRWTAIRWTGRGTLDVVINLLAGDTVVVPGHGALVDRDFVEQQRQDIAITAQTIRDLAGRRRPRRPGAGRGRVALPPASADPRRVARVRAAAPGRP